MWLRVENITGGLGRAYSSNIENKEQRENSLLTKLCTRESTKNDLTDKRVLGCEIWYYDYGARIKLNNLAYYLCKKVDRELFTSKIRNIGIRNFEIGEGYYFRKYDKLELLEGTVGGYLDKFSPYYREKYRSLYDSKNR